MRKFAIITLVLIGVVPFIALAGSQFYNGWVPDARNDAFVNSGNSNYCDVGPDGSDTPNTTSFAEYHHDGFECAPETVGVSIEVQDISDVYFVQHYNYTLGQWIGMGGQQTSNYNVSGLDADDYLDTGGIKVQVLTNGSETVTVKSVTFSWPCP